MFSWTDEETALLMKVILGYKTTKLSEGKDWETIRSKSDDIKQKFSEHYPNEATEEFPRGGNAKEEFTKDRINSKVKKIKNSFRKAVDSGKRSGGGNIVYSLYEECLEIWAGSPSAECVNGGIESATINNANEEKENGDKRYVMSNSLSETDSVENASQETSTEDTSSFDQEDYVEPIAKKMKVTREALMTKLQKQRNSRSIKKIALQEQMSNYIREDMALRNRSLHSRKK